MKATDVEYKMMLHLNIENKCKFENFYSLIKRLSIKDGISLKRAYWRFSLEY